MTRAEWEALWDRDPRATVFSHPAWLEPWADVFAGERVFSHARDAAGALVALLPLCAWDEPGRTRRWVPWGAGHSDYGDVLAAPGWDGRLELPGPVWLPDVPAGSPLLAWGSAEAGEVCPVLRRADGAGFTVPYNMRRNRTKARNRAAALGDVTVGLAGGSELDEALEALIRLAGARLGARGEVSTLADARMRAWLAAALPGLEAAGLLRFVVVRWRGRVVAALLGLADRWRHMSYLVGVDDSVPGQSFGVLAFGALIDLGEARGDREFHFLRGNEGYKASWGAEAVRTWRVGFRVYHLA